MPAPAPTLDDLRRYAVARSLFAPTTLPRAIDKLGFVQADPIRAPARAQDLTLRHRVAGYRAGDLERRYPRLAIEEDCLVNYGFLPRRHLALMHPRTPKRAWDAATHARAADLLAYIREHGPTHPREALAAFDHGRTVGAWGGTLNATTHLLDGMHYRGLLRVARREQGTRVYEASAIDTAHATGAGAGADDALSPEARARALLDLVIAKYAPLPASSLVYLARLLEYGAPGCRAPIRAALQRLKHDAPSALIDGQRWFWPEGESPSSKRWRTPAIDPGDPTPPVRLLAPFDPIVWDRRRFELLWGWAYKFEAYTTPAQRRFGHYALPLLWGEHAIGWANVSVDADKKNRGPTLNVITAYADGRSRRGREFRGALEAEVGRMGEFLGCEG